MRILAIGDLHGKLPEKIKKAAGKSDFVLCTGDFANVDKIRKIIFSNWGEKWFDVIGIKEARKLEKESFNSGLKVLKELNELGKKVHLIFGNSDFYEKRSIENNLFVGNYKSKIKKMKNLVLVDKKIKKVNDIKIIGYGGYVDSTIYIKENIDNTKEEHKKRVKEYNKDKKRLRKLVRGKRGFIFLTHYPPYKILDKIKYKGSPMNGKHLGFLPFNEVIKKNKPILVICGHMHEYQGKKKLGKTIVVNPGYGRMGRYAIMEIDEQSKKIKSIEFGR